VTKLNPTWLRWLAIAAWLCLLVLSIQIHPSAVTQGEWNVSITLGWPQLLLAVVGVLLDLRYRRQRPGRPSR
jgi:hypothetical protein